MKLRRYVRSVAFLTVICGAVVTFVVNYKCSLRFNNVELQAAQASAYAERLVVRPTYFDDRIGENREPLNANPYLRCKDTSGKAAIEDTLCLKRPQYLTQFRNPCWMDKQPGLLRCLPYFHVLGVDKSGTTDLFDRLAKHPHVVPNSGGLGKETYFWCWRKYGQWMKKTIPPISFDDYLGAFDRAAYVISQFQEPDHSYHMITGDGTPMDFWDFRAWPLIPQNENLTEPAVLTPHLMRHLYRDPKFIVILRDPIERLYSDYIFLGYGFTPEKFRSDVPKAISMMEECLVVNTTRQCVFSNQTYISLPMRIHIGMYSVFLKEWLAVFKKSNFYILRTEDYQSNMAHHLGRIYSFLGLEIPPDHIMRAIVRAEHKHQTKAKKKVSDMYPDTRALLQSFYSKYNEELSILLNDTRYLWLPLKLS